MFASHPLGDVDLLRSPGSVPDEKGRSDLLMPYVRSDLGYSIVPFGCPIHIIPVATWGMGFVGVMAATFAFREGAKGVTGIDYDVSKFTLRVLGTLSRLIVQWRLDCA
jgi:hypothetical protein